MAHSTRVSGCGISSEKKVRSHGVTRTTANPPTIAQTTASFTGVNGRATIPRTHSATAASTSAAAVCAWTRVFPESNSATRNAEKDANAATIPAGTAKRRTRRRKPGLARSVLGSSARKKAGIPMVSEPIRVR